MFNLELLQATVEEESIAAVADRLRLPRATIANAIKGTKMASAVEIVLADEFPVKTRPVASIPEETQRRLEAVDKENARILKGFNQYKWVMERQKEFTLKHNMAGTESRIKERLANEAKIDAGKPEAWINHINRKDVMERVGVSNNRLAKLTGISREKITQFMAGQVVTGSPGRRLKEFLEFASHCVENRIELNDALERLRDIADEEERRRL